MIFLLSDKLRKLRMRKNLQQKDVVEYLKVAKSTYSQYESGKSNPDYDTLKKLAVFYEVSLDYLLDNEENNYDYLGRQNEIVTQLDVGVEIHFHNAKKKLTPEQIKMFKAFYKSMTDDSED